MLVSLHVSQLSFSPFLISTDFSLGTKHYIANEQEHFRQAPEAAGFGYNISESISSNIDDTTLHELYLWYVLR
jgi:hypothetical protein